MNAVKHAIILDSITTFITKAKRELVPAGRTFNAILKVMHTIQVGLAVDPLRPFKTIFTAFKQSYPSLSEVVIKLAFKDPAVFTNQDLLMKMIKKAPRF